MYLCMKNRIKMKKRSFILLMAAAFCGIANLKKKWKIIDGKRVLLKDSSAPYRQEAYNEVLASEIANRLGIPHVPYTLIAEHGEICSGCEDFITPSPSPLATTSLFSKSMIFFSMERFICAIY